MHLSNLNFNADGMHDVAITQLIDLYASSGSDGEQLDFIFCTGDIAVSGREEEYEAATQFFYRLSEVTRVPLERIFTVPGNHDVDRNRIRRAFRLDLPDKESVENLFSSEEDLAVALRPFHNYISFELRVFGRAWTTKNPYLSSSCSLRGFSVAILGFNTAWNSQEDESMDEIVIGYPLAENLIREVLQGEPDLVVVLMHHPVTHLVAYERDRFQLLLSRNADFVLHGHVHSPEGFEIDSNLGDAVILGSGSCGRNQVHMRSFLTVDVSGKNVQIEPRTYNETRGGRWDRRDSKVATLNVSRSRRSLRYIDLHDTVRFPFDVRSYLMDLRRYHSYISGAELVSDGVTPAIDINKVYVTPNVQIEARTEVRGSSRPDETLDIDALLSRGRRILILGGPGVGKTTILRKLVLDKADKLLAAGPDIAETIKQIPVYLPVRRLWDLGCDVPNNLIEQAVFKEFEPFTRTQSWLSWALERGRILLLLDGLDEAPTHTQTDVLAQIRNFAARWPKTAMVLTSRPINFTHLGRDFLVCHLQPFSENQVEAFVKRIFSNVLRRRELAERTASALLDILRIGTSVAAWVFSPLMLSLMVSIYLRHGKVPVRRAELYSTIVETFLGRLDEAKGISSSIGQLSMADRTRILQRVALAVHERGPGNNAFDISDIEQIFKDDSATKDYTSSVARALLEYSTARAGLLIETRPGSWVFIHMSIQEYLAACAVVESATCPEDVLVKHIADPWWREVVLLALEVMENQSVKYERKVWTKLEKMVATQVPASERADAYGVLAAAVLDTAVSSNQVLRQVRTLRDTALKIIEDARQPGSIWARVQLAHLLGRAGDPRLGWEDDKQFVSVPAGSFIMGDLGSLSVEDERPPTEVFVSDYLIGRFLVTRSQFSEFVDSGGYQKEKYWSAEFGRRTDIDSLAERLRAEPNLPITDVSWFEADAFCRWLNDVRPRLDGLHWRLPTEAEWEKAARRVGKPGAELSTDSVGRMYPWGDDWSPQRANAAYTFDRPTPVGLFPLGEGPYRTLDQAGNVSEWCQDGYWTYGGKQRGDPLGMTSSAVRAIRGGDWTSSPREIRSSSRAWSPSTARGERIGFRVVASSVTPIPARPPNPFLPGIALPPDAPPPGRMVVISEVTSRIAEHGSCVLLGPRRSGKTSILRYLRTVLGDRQSVRFLDLQGKPCRTPDVLAASIETRLSEHSNPAAALKDFLQKEHEPVILLDEIGRLQSADVTADPNVFEWLRSLAQEAVVLVLAGTDRDWDLAQAKDAEKPGSSFANIMKPIHLGPLPESEAIAFLSNTAPDDVPIDPEGVGRWIVKLTGGWPFYLQVLGHALVEEVRGRQISANPRKGDIQRLYEQALLYQYEFVFRQRWRELDDRTRGILLGGRAGALPEPSTLSPFDIEHLERQGLFHQRRGWLLSNDGPFIDWLKEHYRGLVSGIGGEQ
jgi:formylglycine-generating enzyme required for sulfatase activity/predicted phosphodiesterase/energy-coupling factor transporter ATP-binding protein EcfA2